MAEKSFSQIPRNLRELYEKGNAALQKKNFDYALAIYNQVLQGEPGFYDCRAALRASQLSKAEAAGGGFFKKVFGTASVSPLIAKAQFQVRNNPVEALATCEQILNSEPNNTAAHKILAEAAMALEFPRTAVLSLEIAFKNYPRDLEIGLRLGEALVAAGQAERAHTIYSELQKANPNDPALAQAAKNAAAKRTLREGGYEALESGTGSYRDILRDKSEAASLEQESRQVKTEDVATELIREYQARLQKEPNNRRLLRSIADLYLQKKEFDRALEYYQQIATVEGGIDPSLEKAIADTRIRQIDHRISLLDATAPDYQAERDAIEKEKQELEIAEARRRVDAYPNDLAFRFELGELLFRAGKIPEAIPELQKAQNHPHKRIRSLYYLGQCFSHRNMHDLAVRSFQKAISEKQVMDEEKKDLIYALGVVLEKQGKAAEAIEQFKQIYEIDYGYRDVSTRVDSYYASGA